MAKLRELDDDQEVFFFGFTLEYIYIQYSSTFSQKKFKQFKVQFENAPRLPAITAKIDCSWH